MNQLALKGMPTTIDQALQFAVKTKRGNLESDEVSTALAAAEVVAAACGHRDPELPDEVKEWLAESAYSATPKSIALAVQATERVRDDTPHVLCLKRPSPKTQQRQLCVT